MKKLFIMIVALGATLMASGQGQMSVSTQLFLDQQKGITTPFIPKVGKKAPRQVAARSLNGTQVVDCFVTLNGRSIADIEAVGGRVQARFGDNLVTASIPVDQIENLAAKNTVKRLSVAQMMQAKTDYARQKTNVNQVLAGLSNNLPANYTGKDVVVGVVDDGIEFNHIAFKTGGTSSGTTRVKLAYLPGATSANGGSAPVIDGTTLPGYQYTTASQIANLTTDDTGESHGTHTSGCAGGSHVNTYNSTTNTYSGMAPECDLVLCGCGSDLSDTNIANSCKLIASYAQSVGKPCVINLSLGNNTGPHDGSDEICQALDAVAEEYGAIILISAGNEGADAIWVGGTSTSSTNPTVATVLKPNSDFTSYYGSTYLCYGGIDAWSNSRTSFSVQFVLMDASGSVVWTSNKVSTNTTINASNTGTGSNALSSYVGSSSSITVYGYRDTNDRYNVYFTADLRKKSSTYYLGAVYYANSGVKIDCFNSRSDFNDLGTISNSTYNFTAGTGEYSLNGMATGFKTISIGAYASRLSVPYYYGQRTGSMSNGDYEADDIAYFSSYGTDYNGYQHPFISSPGHTVVSSVNRHDTEQSWTESALRVSLGSGNYDYWMYMSGTSMAAPVAAGIVALWLECDPTLDVDAVKDVMKNTCINDSHMPQANVRWGCGKIDAYAGIKYILAKDRKVYILGNVVGDWDPMVGQEMETEDGIIHTATLDAVDSGDGASYFSFTTQLATQSGNSGWDEIAGSRFGAANSDGNYWITDSQLDTPIGLAASGQSFRIPKGKYTLTVDYDNMTLTVHKEYAGNTLEEAIELGDGDYIINDDLRIVDYADRLDYISVTDGNGNWMTVTADENIFNAIYEYNTLKGGTIKGTISGSELNPVLTLTATPEESTEIVNFEQTSFDLTQPFHPVVNELCLVSGYYNANDGALRAYSGLFGKQGQSLIVDTSWGSKVNTLQDGKYYRNVPLVITLINPWSSQQSAPARKIAADDDNYFQNYRGYALRVPAPDTSTGVDDVVVAQSEEPVNVYNLQGVLLRKAVMEKDATVGLTPGFYIVGNKKVLVK